MDFFGTSLRSSKFGRKVPGLLAAPNEGQPPGPGNLRAAAPAVVDPSMAVPAQLRLVANAMGLAVMCDHYRWPWEFCADCSRVSRAVASRLRSLDDLPLRSSWDIERGQVYRTDVKERRRVERGGRERQRAVIRERVETIGKTTPREYSMESARAELRRRLDAHDD